MQPPTRKHPRRLRRKVPSATIILGCCIKEIDPAALELLREGTKADLIAASLGEAVKLCIQATGTKDQRQESPRQGNPNTEAA